ncbi:head maturation protease, ClpP-related [Bacillus sp. 166amftsu]|uniref:head maturation protease, ClpP-related n=1 Tax=Bacillus sp. 166amftsu TaxID=1761753 RepID=UPI0008959E32|nr:head maturation protease, ClpP-related [Bacillus sp. 166amftsu]SDY43005.1 ATP-dependent protease ClpP, protease subunit [Bacillus sp. 166amftsu]
MRRYKNEKYSHLANVQHSFKAETEGDSSTITIYGSIGESWWGESTSAKDIENALNNVKSDTVTLRLNSGGGDVFDGIAIYNQLKNHSAKVIVHVDGLAASAASLIAMAADELIMNTGSMLMIHEASTFAWGTKSDIQKTLNALEGIDKSIADIYMTRFEGERSEIETMIENETWFTASEAVEIGLADKVDEEEEKTDPEEYKNNFLQMFRNKKKQSEPIVASTNQITGMMMNYLDTSK